MTTPGRSSLFINAVLAGLLLAANLVVANVILRKADRRWDLTEDKRFEISDNSKRILDRIEGTVSVKCYFSSELPKRFNHVERIVAEKLAEYEQLSDGKVIFEIVDPTAPGHEDDLQDLADMGVQVVQLEDTEGAKDRKVLDCYLLMVFRYGDRKQVVNLFQDCVSTLASPSDFAGQLEFLSTQAIHNASSPRKTVGFLAELAKPNPRAQQPQQPTGQQGLEYLKAYVGRMHDTKIVDPTEVNRGSMIPDEIDVLVCARLRDVSEAGLFVIDQYLMRGGDILFLVDQGTVNFDPKPKTTQFGNAQLQDFDLPNYDSILFLDNLVPMLEHWGVRVTGEMVEDRSAFEIQYLQSKEMVRNAFGGVYIKPIYGPARYPSWMLLPARDQDGKVLDPEQLDPDWPLLASTDDLLMIWASPLELVEDAMKTQDLSAEVLVRSGPESWRRALKDNLFSPAPGEWSEPAEKKRSNLAVLVEGRFASYFAGREVPKVKNPGGGETEVYEKLLEGRLDRRAEPGRVIVVGDADFVYDSMFNGIGVMGQNARKSRQELYDYVAPWATSLRFTKNLVDVLCYGDEAKDMFRLLNREVRDRGLKEVAEGSSLMTRVVGIALGLVPGLILLLGLVRIIYRRVTTGAVSV